MCLLGQELPEQIRYPVQRKVNKVTKFGKISGKEIYV